MEKEQGFSLIELLIVVAIIGIIAAIAIPNLLQARKTANEASAIGALRTVGSSQVTYQGNNQVYGTLAQLGTAALVDSTLTGSSATNPKSGFYYTDALAAPTATNFNVAATAATTSAADRKFCVVEDGVIRFDNASGQSATAFTDTTGRAGTALGSAASS